MPLAMPGGIEAGACQVPQRHYARHTIGLFAGRRNGAAQRFDLQNAKGRPFSRRVIFSRSSSLSTQTPATTDFKRLTSSSSASFSRLFSMASPPAKKRSRHSLSAAAVTRCLREVDSRSAPRSNSRTTDVLRFADHRPAPGSGADSGDCSVALRAPSAAPESALFVLDMLSSFRTFSLQMFPTSCPTKFRAGRGSTYRRGMEWLNYHPLLYFWAVAKTGSVTRASQELRLAQPTISAQVRALEEDL